MYEISDEVKNFIKETKKNWREELTAGGKSLAAVKIQIGIFQEDTLSPLLFVITMMPLSHILRKCTESYKLHKSWEKFNHLIYMDNIKLFPKNEKEKKTLILAVRICCEDIGIEFKIEKCAMLIMRSRKRQVKEGIELLNQEKNQNTQRKRNLQVLGNIGIGHHQTTGDEIKIKKVYIRRARKLLQTKLYSRNLIKGINTWAVPFARYSGLFLNWMREELQQMDQRTRKLITMHKALYPRNDKTWRLHKKDWLQLLETTQIIQGSTENHV